MLIFLKPDSKVFCMRGFKHNASYTATNSDAGYFLVLMMVNREMCPTSLSLLVNIQLWKK